MSDNRWDDRLRTFGGIDKPQRAIYRRLEARNAYLARRLSKQQHNMSQLLASHREIVASLKTLRRCVGVIAAYAAITALQVAAENNHLKIAHALGQKQLQWLGSHARELFTMVAQSPITETWSNFTKGIVLQSLL